MNLTRLHVAALALLLLQGTEVLAELKVFLPQNRTAFQTNEWIDVSVLRSSPMDLPAGTLRLELSGKDGSRLSASFPVPARKVEGKGACSTEHYHVNGWLLRPGAYQVIVALGEEKATTELEVHAHLRQSSFRLINWGRADKRDRQLVQGEDSLGFNTYYGGYGHDDEGNFIRSGVDFIANCVMSGGHQMDLRLECDWSDPHVTRGGTRRVVRRAMFDRTRPNVPGVHFYDEPGLTWGKDSVTGEFTPHAVAAQHRSYKAAFDRDTIPYHKIHPNNQEHVAFWKHWITWRLGFMDAAWKEAQFGVSTVRPDFLSLTQSQYGFSAFTDGYYFNVARSLPITSGHGGYHDFGPGYFNPSYFLEMARARDLWKPCWYLPTWYGNTTSDHFRLEQYLSFQTGIQGVMSPPDLEPSQNATGRAGIVESNQTLKRLGPIFTTMPPSKPPVAMLYSLSQAIHTQTKDRKKNYLHESPQGRTLVFTYLAGKLINQPFLPIVEEDVLDGTLASDHKAVVLSSLDYLDPKVVTALESFIDGGGVVLKTGDSTVKVKGSIKLPVTPGLPDEKLIEKLGKEKGKEKEVARLQSAGKYLEGATPLANAIDLELRRKNIIRPVSATSGIVSTRHGSGDVEYFFLVNATPDLEYTKDPRNGIKAVNATVSLHVDAKRSDDHYDALTGGPVPEFARATPENVSGEFSFGPGQMRVIARIKGKKLGGIRLAEPVVHRDLVLEREPIGVELAATVIDDRGRPLSGSIPIHIRVFDSLGVERHTLYRATKLGQWNISLPLAATDPAGKWKVFARELLGNNEDVVEFDFTPPPRVRSWAGATERAVFAGDDREKAFRFARLFHDVTIVKGKSAFNDRAAERLIKILGPWGVRCKVMDLEKAAKPRSLTEEEAATWCGLIYAPTKAIKSGDGNPPALVGFAVQGPVILLGNAEDNPIIAFLDKERFLPYKAQAGVFPGVGRGMFAWQRDGIGAGQESITLIAHDEKGMSEAVGSLYEAVAGIDPLTKWLLPDSDSLQAAKSPLSPRKEIEATWSARLSDRIVALRTEGGKLVAISQAGEQAEVQERGLGKIGRIDPLEIRKASEAHAAALAGDTKRHARPDRLTKFVASEGGKTAVAYWGGTLQIIDAKGTLAEQQMPQDVSALAWRGGILVLGLADGRILALRP